MSGEVDWVEALAPAGLRVKRREVTESLEIAVDTAGDKVRIRALKHAGGETSSIFEMRMEAGSADHLVLLLQQATVQARTPPPDHVMAV